MANLPNLLSTLRLALVPVLLVLARAGQAKLFLAGLLASLITDATGGLLARRLNQTSQLGAKLDSWADFVTCLALPWCAWSLRPDVIRQEGLYIGAGILFYLAALAAGFLKFKRLTSYHTWGAKLSALLFGAAVVVLFAGGPGW